MGNRPLIESLAEEYSAAVRAAGYSNPDLIRKGSSLGKLDDFAAANPGLRFQPEIRLLLTSFGETRSPHRLVL